MSAKELLEKLESYEQSAYDGGIGVDWLANIGEGFKFYVQSCLEEGKRVTIAGFEKWIDERAKEAKLVD